MVEEEEGHDDEDGWGEGNLNYFLNCPRIVSCSTCQLGDKVLNDKVHGCWTCSLGGGGR